MAIILCLMIVDCSWLFCFRGCPAPGLDSCNQNPFDIDSAHNGISSKWCPFFTQPPGQSYGSVVHYVRTRYERLCSGAATFAAWSLENAVVRAVDGPINKNIDQLWSALLCAGSRPKTGQVKMFPYSNDWRDRPILYKDVSVLLA